MGFWDVLDNSKCLLLWRNKYSIVFTYSRILTNYSNNIIEIIEYSNSALKLWPNPTAFGGIYFSDNRSGSIYDIIGNKISEFINTDFVDISRSPPGLYMLKTLQGEVFSVVRH